VVRDGRSSRSHDEIEQDKAFGEERSRKEHPNGTPLMYLACASHLDSETGQSIVCFGANSRSWDKGNWPALPNMVKYDRELRNLRLASYQAMADQAFNKLRQVDEEAHRNAGASVAKRVSELRNLAIEKMRADSINLLGRTREVGQAYSFDFERTKCCYFCRGMTGYSTAKHFPQGDLDRYAHTAE